MGGVSKGGALANTNCASRGVLFQTLKTLGFFGTCQEIYFSSWEEAQPRPLLVKSVQTVIVQWGEDGGVLIVPVRSG